VINENKQNYNMRYFLQIMSLEFLPKLAVFTATLIRLRLINSHYVNFWQVAGFVLSAILSDYAGINGQIAERGQA
jgi:hypothetical protein